MVLTQLQRQIIAKARSVGGGAQGIALSDEACAYLVAVIAGDLGLLPKLTALHATAPPFFGTHSRETLTLPGLDFLELFQRLVELDNNADTYFACLAALHKARLKYERILQTQPLPTIEQVGARGLLQYGTLSPKALTAFLIWRKWLFDIDNRAGQETGYVFEPILAAAIGGVPVSATKSPIRRQADATKGRQVDCILQDKKKNKAYEIKIRVTMAASGQGRWKEELDFPSDCRTSGFTPILVVLDPTRNPKLKELEKKFLAEKGEVYIGDKAWRHFGKLAGPTMSRFLELYVHLPLKELLAGVPKSEELPELRLNMKNKEFIMSLAGEKLTMKRMPRPKEESPADELPVDVDDQVPGP